MLWETRVGKAPDVGELVRVGRGAQEPRDDASPPPHPHGSRGVAPGGLDVAAGRSDASIRCRDQRLPRGAGTDRVDGETQPRRARAEASSKVRHAHRRPAIEHRGQHRSGGFFGVRGGRAGEADEIESLASGLPQRAETGLHRHGEAVLVMVRDGPGSASRCAPDGAEGGGREPISRHVDADAGDADDRLSHQSAAPSPGIPVQVTSARRSDRGGRCREGHADPALRSRAAAGLGRLVHDVTVSRPRDGAEAKARGLELPHRRVQPRPDQVRYERRATTRAAGRRGRARGIRGGAL